MAHLIGKAELLNRSRRVAAADDGDSAALGNSSRDSYCAVCEVIPLGDSHRSVPDNGSAALNCICEKLSGFGADIKTHPACGELVGIDCLILSIGVELLTDNIVDGKKELNALFGRLVHHILGKLDLVLLNK